MRSERFFYMTHSIRNLTKALIFTAAACALALAASSAYAAESEDNPSVSPEAQVWVYEKAAVSENPSIIRINAPSSFAIVPLEIDFNVTNNAMSLPNTAHRYGSNVDLRDFDLVEDSPLFIGARGASEFDTRDAQHDTGAYPETLGVTPLYTVAGAGVSTSF